MVSSWVVATFSSRCARIFWVKPSVTFLTDFVQSNHIERIVTTWLPHSIHLIGQRLKKKLPSILWLADFRDPGASGTCWVRCPDGLGQAQTPETGVLGIVAGRPRGHDRALPCLQVSILGNRKVELITNRFDEEDFAGIQRARTKSLPSGILA